MKNLPSKKLLGFIPIVIGMFAANTNAQIVFTDVSPDVTNSCSGNYCSQQYNLDLNGDGFTDFILESFHSFSYTVKPSQNWTSSYVRITPQGLNSYVTDNGNAKVISEYDKIDSVQSWQYSTSQYLKYYYKHNSYSTNSGGWNSGMEKYIGLKINLNNQIYYGWIRLNVSVSLTSASLTIKDFAFDTIANHFILAGESSCSIPTATLSANGPLTFCNGSYVTLTVSGTGHLFQWKKNGVDLVGAKYQSLNVSTPGKYKCMVSNTCGSKTSKADTIKVPCRNADSSLSITDGDELEHLSIYPNPATNSISIKFPSDEKGQIQIINLFGQIVLSEKIFADETKIDVTKFSDGMYVVRWSSGENYETKTFSVVK